VEQEPPPASSWELIFERLPLSDRHACRAQVALSRHETDGIRLSATLSDGRARLFALQAVVTGFADDDGPLTLSEWHEGTAI